MSTAKVFILVFLSENFSCQQSQNVKVRKKSFVVKIPECQIKKTKLWRQQKISLKNNKNTSNDMLLLEFFSYFDIMRMSTAKIFILLFLSENFCC